MSTNNKTLITALAFFSLLVIALNLILQKFSADLGIFNTIANLICNIIIAVIAYGFVESQRGKARKTWLIIYIVMIIVILVFTGLTFIK